MIEKQNNETFCEYLTKNDKNQTHRCGTINSLHSMVNQTLVYSMHVDMLLSITLDSTLSSSRITILNINIIVYFLCYSYLKYRKYNIRFNYFSL